MTPQQIIDGMSKKCRELSMKNNELADLGEKRAQTERDYNKALAGEMLKLKADGMSITLIKDVCKGAGHVADLGFKRDVADAMYKACAKQIEAINQQIDTYRSFLTWQRAEMGRQTT